MTREIRYVLLAALAALAAVTGTALAVTGAGAAGRAVHSSRLAGARAHDGRATVAGRDGTRTPIKHVVVIFQENVSFDHYFGTYPNATNTDGQKFTPAPGTPAVDGLAPATTSSLPARLRHHANLLTDNPNSAAPQRLDSHPKGVVPGQGQLTCDQDHDYSDEQKAFDSGKMDAFVQATGTGAGAGPTGAPCKAAQVMDYYDGSTVTALWNYAQHFAMSDNSFGTAFGPSSPGAINLASGDTGNVDMAHTANNPSIATPAAPDADLTANGRGGYSLTSDAQPYYDDCSTRDAVALTGENIGDLLNSDGVSWGWFQGGFTPTTTFQQGLAAVGKTGQPTSTFVPDEFAGAGLNAQVPHSSNQALCDAVHPIGVALGGTGQWGYKDDYIPHHEPFDYYASTANPHHLTVPSSNGQDTLAGLSEIGTDTQSYVNGQPQYDTPNHQYDTGDFQQLVAAIGAGQLPASALPGVSFVKAPGYQDGHGAYSDPADEQAFITKLVNGLEKTPAWPSTAVIVNYDDSDGWYDHVYSGVTNPSASSADNLTPSSFGTTTTGQCSPTWHSRQTPLDDEQGRCGFGPRLPMLLISPFAKTNHVDHSLSDQASIINMIEYNWHLEGIPGSADDILTRVDRASGHGFDLAGMFDFHGSPAPKLFLSPSTGQPTG